MKASRIAQSDLCAVSVCEGGKARVDGCLIAGSRGPGICAVDLGDAVARHCVLREGHEAGVLVSKRGSARLFCNEILANSRPGVVVCRGGVASLARNKIHSGREEGVWVCERSAAVLVENEVHNNAHAGVWASSAAHIELCRNLLHHGLSEGVVVEEVGTTAAALRPPSALRSPTLL